MSHLFSFLGRPFSPIYSLIMKLRSVLYQRGFFKSFRSDALVISVGNLTMGGTGKSPFVQLISSYLQNNGYTVAVVSRGYGGSAAQKVNLVSTGGKPLLNAKEAGDEPRLHAETLPGVTVATGTVRKLPCQFVVDQLNCNAIVLDDGFQHLGVQRDLNLVLFNSTTLAGNSRVFPGGELREPVSSLLRADAFILTGTTKFNRDRANRFAKLLNDRFPGRPVFFTSYVAVKAKQLGQKELLALSRLPTPLYGFCGIAHPSRFKNSLIEQDINLCGFSAFKDHQSYYHTHLNKLINKARQSKAAGLITTEKDSVKIQDCNLDFPIFSLVMEVRVEKGFWEFFNKKLDKIAHEQ